MSVQVQPTSRAVPKDRRPVDPRGQRFGAAITTVVFAAVIVLGPTAGATALLLALQTLAFAAAAFLGLQAHPYGLIFRKFIRPRLAAPRTLEDPAAPRFAQTVGLVFALVATAGLILSVPVLFYVAAGMALAAAFLNAVFNFCLGCEMYLIIRRFA